MSSVDFTGTSGRPQQQQQQYLHHNAPRLSAGAGSPGRYAPPTSGQRPLQNHLHGHAYTHSQPQQSLAPSTVASEAGRTKTEQVVLEFLYKAAELVIQSRVNFQSEAGHRRGNRRARFNLDIEEVQFVRDAMAAWRENVHLPLAVSVYLDSDSDRRVLLEQWSVVYTLDSAAAAESDPHSARRTGSSTTSNITSNAAAPRDVIQQLKEVCKKISVLLRSLYSFMRLLPAHRLVQRALAAHVTYELHAAAANDSSGFERDASTSRYSFVPIATPFGFLKVATVYRTNVERMREEEEAAQPAIFKANCIIQDYVPSSPELLAQRDSSNLAASSMRARAATAYSPEPVRSPMMMRAATAAALPVSTDQRRRSSPSQIVGADDDSSAARRTPSLSRPMAIPQTKTQTPASVAFDDARIASPHEREMLHAHSFGDADRLRAVAANPNVTAAPYGYGNVTIERGHTPPSHWTSMASSNNSNSNSGGLTPSPNTNATSSANNGASIGSTATSYQDESAPFPLSTPPRHPNSLLSLKHSRTFSASSTGARKSNSDSTHVRSSLENFSLDDNATTSPGAGAMAAAYSPSARSLSPSVPPVSSLADRVGSRSTNNSDRAVPFAFHSRRHESFSGAAFATDTSSSSATDRDGAATNSPRSTPPFMFAEAPTTLESPGSTTAALVLRRTSTSLVTEPARTVPVFASSPPFQANPTELLSTSPGYSYSTNYLRKGGRSSLPMFITTDQFQLGRTANALRLHSGSANGNGAGALDPRGFSPDLYETGAGVWGVSPDSPGSFGLALTDVSNSGQPRLRFLSSSGSAGTGTGTGTGDDSRDGATASQFDPYDMSDLLLPFALGDNDDHSTATTVTSTLGSETERASGGADSTSGRAWDTASVGSFLNQLKHAPRLQMFQDTSALPRERSEHAPLALNAQATEVAAPQLLFDDELASFRTLRDELARDR